MGDPGEEWDAVASRSLGTKSRILYGVGAVLCAMVALLAISAVIAALTWAGSPSGWQTFLQTLGGLAVAVGAGWAVVRLARLFIPEHEEHWVDRPTPDVFDDPDFFAKHIERAMSNVSARYSNAATTVFRSFLADKTRLVRANEQAEPADDSLLLAVMLDFVLSDSERKSLEKDQTLLVPLMTLKKGVLLDNLTITDASDADVPTLSQHETMGILAYAITTLFYLAFVADSATTPQPVRNLTKEEEDAQWELVQLVCQRGVRFEAEVAKDFDRAIRDLPATRMELVTDLKEFCEFFAAHYLIIAEVPLPPGNHVIVKYQKSIPLYGRTATKEDRRRVKAGLKPYRFRIPLTLPFQTPSYHFRASGRPGQFVSSHYIEDTATRVILNNAAFAEPGFRTYVRARYKAALPYAHLYARGLHEVAPREVSTVVEFEEVPPGAVGSARAVSGVAAAILAAFAFILPGPGSTNSDLAALLLAAPVFAASWVGYTAERMERSSLATYVGLLITAAVSVAAALLYVSQTKTGWPALAFDLTIDEAGVVLPAVDILWLLLAAPAIVVTVHLSLLLHRKRQRYLEMLDRWK